MTLKLYALSLCAFLCFLLTLLAVALVAFVTLLDIANPRWILMFDLCSPISWVALLLPAGSAGFFEKLREEEMRREEWRARRESRLHIFQ